MSQGKGTGKKTDVLTEGQIADRKPPGKGTGEKTDALTGGDVRKGNVNTRPTTPRPSPPEGQGGKSSSEKR